jgi:hypothetical protein
LGVVAAELVFWSWLAALGRFFRVGRSCSVLDFVCVFKHLIDILHFILL